MTSKWLCRLWNHRWKDIETASAVFMFSQGTWKQWMHRELCHRCNTTRIVPGVAVWEGNKSDGSNVTVGFL